MLDLLKENKVTLGAAVIVLSALGASMKVTLPVEEALATHITMEYESNLANEIEKIRWEIKGIERELRMAEDLGWPPHDIQDLKELKQWYEDRLQQLLDRMRQKGQG